VASQVIVFFVGLDCSIAPALAKNLPLLQSYSLFGNGYPRFRKASTLG
jgi:hypothetical protein